ncbi:MAG: NAD(P)H-binding protein [Myxococcota bacterium]
MNDAKKLFVLGAAGRTGRAVVERALENGSEVTAFCRASNPLKLEHPRLQIVAAKDPFEVSALTEAAAGHHAVVCAVGAPGRDRSQVRTRVAEALKEALPAAGVNRLLVVSTFGASETRPQLPWIMRCVIVPLLLGPGFQDHDGQEGVIRGMDLNWTLVRPPNLTDAPPTGRYRLNADLSDRTVWKISRADLARAIVDMVDDPTHHRRAVFVSC